MKNIFIKITLTALLLTPLVSSAQTLGPSNTTVDCLVDSGGECYIAPNPGPGPGPNPIFNEIWTGGWYSSFGVFYTVIAGSYLECTNLLEAATQGMNVVTSVCRKLS